MTKNQASVARSILVAILGITAAAMSAKTALACGFVAELLDSATLGPYRSKIDPGATSKNVTDLVTVEVTILPGGTTRWHIHPGLSFALVQSGVIEISRFSNKRGCTSQFIDDTGGFFVAADEVHNGTNGSNVNPVVTRFTLDLREGQPFLIPVAPPDCATDDHEG